MNKIINREGGLKLQNLSQNLKYLLRVHNGLSILELAKQTQIPQPTLHHIINGETKKPRSNVLEVLANFFYVSVDQLTGVKPLPVIPHALKEDLKISTIPIIDWDSLGSSHPANVAHDSRQEIILDKRVDAGSFALILQNSDHEPLFPNKSLLLFNPTKVPKDRDFVLVNLKEQNRIIFNRIFYIDLNKYIKENEIGGKVQLIKIKPEDKIIACLFEVRLKF